MPRRYSIYGALRQISQEKTGRPSRAALHDQIVCISKKCNVSIVVERPVVFLDEIYPGLDILQTVHLIEESV